MTTQPENLNPMFAKVLNDFTMVSAQAFVTLKERENAFREKQAEEEKENAE